MRSEGTRGEALASKHSIEGPRVEALAAAELASKHSQQQIEGPRVKTLGPKNICSYSFVFDELVF